MTIQEILQYASEKLRKENKEEPMLKARLLLCSILGVTKEYLIINGNKELDKITFQKYENGIQKLLRRISYTILDKLSRIYEVKLLC